VGAGSLESCHETQELLTRGEGRPLSGIKIIFVYPVFGPTPNTHVFVWLVQLSQNKHHHPKSDSRGKV